MFEVGTKVRDLYEHSETHTVVRRTKAQRASDVMYFGSEAKADQWVCVRSDLTGQKMGNYVFDSPRYPG